MFRREVLSNRSHSIWVHHSSPPLHIWKLRCLLWSRTECPLLNEEQRCRWRPYLIGSWGFSCCLHCHKAWTLWPYGIQLNEKQEESLPFIYFLWNTSSDFVWENGQLKRLRAEKLKINVGWLCKFEFAWKKFDRKNNDHLKEFLWNVMKKINFKEYCITHWAVGQALEWVAVQWRVNPSPQLHKEWADCAVQSLSRNDLSIS